MKILFLSTSSVRGGAFTAASRLYNGIRAQGTIARILTRSPVFPDTSFPPGTLNYKPISQLFYSKLANLILKFRPGGSLVNRSLNCFDSGLANLINRSDFDIVHLHWINDEMISIREIAAIRKPILWTLHDMWAFCGAEHISYEQSPTRYEQGYHLGNPLQNKSFYDIDRATWNQKRKNWHNTKFNFVTPSHWLCHRLKSSYLFKNNSVAVIPNGININHYSPGDKSAMRQKLGLPLSSTLIAFGAMNSTRDSNKGIQFLPQIFKHLQTFQHMSKISLIVFGDSPTAKIELPHINLIRLGLIKNHKQIRDLYRAVDITIVPSKLENFPNAVLESMACGTPVVAFDVGGISDLIEHRKNGCLAQPFDTQEFANCINWMMNSAKQLEQVSRLARETVEHRFDLNISARCYIDLYQKILSI